MTRRESTTAPSSDTVACSKSSPQEPVSLNNLAYALAVHKKAPAEALPIAQQAYEASEGAAVERRHAWLDLLPAGQARGG